MKNKNKNKVFKDDKRKLRNNSNNVEKQQQYLRKYSKMTIIQ